MPNPSIVLIHGLHNRPEAFWPLRDSLEASGFKVHLICLPGHGENRGESGDWKNASGIFKKSLQEVTQGPYVAIAFSQGGLYFQHYLQDGEIKKPLGQILLAPALFVRNFSKLSLLVNFLPKVFPIISIMPKDLRRYSFLYVREYALLFEGVNLFGKNQHTFSIPTEILIDPKDEVVDAQKIQSVFPEQVRFIDRPYLKGKPPGKHHIIFHPEYFESETGWKKFVEELVLILRGFRTSHQD